MRFGIKHAVLLGALALLAVPAAAPAGGPPGNPGAAHEKADRPTTTTTDSAPDPGPGAGVPAAARPPESRHAHGLRLDRTGLLSNACNGKGATLLVNVTFTLTNDADSGFAGNEWASDTIHRKLRIWREADGSYCAVVGDTGSFTTLAGTSPNQTGTVSAGVTGRLQGGYVATFSGTPAATAAYASHGNLGSYDLQCDANFNCPGAHPSFTSYFDPTPSYTLTAWGWIYRTAGNGTWVNQSSGSSGDITS